MNYKVADMAVAHESIGTLVGNFHEYNECINMIHVVYMFKTFKTRFNIQHLSSC